MKNQNLNRYFVHYSSWFDSHNYDKELMKQTIKDNGGKNIHYANNHGWNNQPQVVCFNTVENNLTNIKQALQQALKTQWIIIRKKDF